MTLAVPAPTPTPPGRGLPSARPEAVDPRLAEVARQFEATFLAEMLKHTGLGKMPESWNGGVGEQGFSDFLVREYADQIARERPLGIGAAMLRGLAARGPGG